MKINRSFFVKLFHDLVLLVASLFFSYSVRFNFEIPVEHLLGGIKSLIILLPVHLFFLLYGNLYISSWRYSSAIDLKKLIFQTVLGGVTFAVLIFIFSSNFFVPKSILLLYPLISILFLGGGRFIYRSFYDYKIYGINVGKGKPIIIYTDGFFLPSLIKFISNDIQWRIVGILTDDLSLHNQETFGIKVYGGKSNISKILSEHHVNDLIFSTHKKDSKSNLETINYLSKFKLNIFTLSNMTDLINPGSARPFIRPIIIDDLLGREEVQLDNKDELTNITDKIIFVSGAGGSIGSEICRQILKHSPKLLICFDISEFSLYSLEQSLKDFSSRSKIIYLVGDIKNKKRLDQIFLLYKPEMLYHAAAYKHVPLMENENVCEAIMNNVIGTFTLGQSANKAKLKKFVLVSTDKAVNPTNVMGASKYLAEIVCKALQHQNFKKKLSTQFVIVRFGNVLGSSGSVIPKFKEQIANGGPVTLTHPKITRYFMSIPEAAKLVIQAGLIGSNADIFLLDMGTPIKIVDLAKNMIRLSGYSEKKIIIKYIGLRPGEKLHEELLAESERSTKTPYKKLNVLRSKTVDKTQLKKLLFWINQINHMTEGDIKKELKLWVPGYSSK